MIGRKWIVILSLAFIAYAFFTAQYSDYKKKQQEAAVGTTLAKDEPAPESAAKEPGSTAKKIVSSIATSDTGEKIIGKAFNYNGPLVKTAPSSQDNNDSTLRSLDSILGDGPKARCGQAVTMHYSLMQEDGTPLDSTRQSNRPITFMIGKQQVIHGLELGVIGMQQGGIRKLTIPPQLAYDDPRFATQTVAAKSTIKAEVELLKIIPGATMAPDLKCK